MEKTEDQIQKDKEAVAKMIGAKGAMEAMIRRHEDLENALKAVAGIASDLGKRCGEDLYINTFCHSDRSTSGPKIIPVRDQLRRIAEICQRVS